MEPVLVLRGIVKEFPGVRAVDNVSLEFYEGEVFALVGENGAGKTTLMRVIAGVYPYGTYRGEMFLHGRKVAFRHPREARGAGIAMIHQELYQVPGLPVYANLFLGRERTRFGLLSDEEMKKEAEKIFREMGEDIPIDAKIKDLGIGLRQMVEIAKAVSQNAKIIIFDEPTSALSERETEKLFEIIERLKKQRKLIIYISHRLDEIFRIADRVGVMRDGKLVAVGPLSEFNKQKLVALMVGREISDVYPKQEVQLGNVIFEVSNWTVEGVTQGKRILRIEDVNLKVRSGEIFGIAGLVGAGRTEFVLSLFGAWGERISGEIRVGGMRIVPKAPQDLLNAGVGLVPEDRHMMGLVLKMTALENITLASLKELSRFGIVDGGKERGVVERFIESLSIKPPRPFMRVENFSGGNQQKVVLAKSLALEPKVLIMDEPTRGIDVGAKYEVYKIMCELAGRGMAIIFVSSELPELIGMCDRIAIMRGGRIVRVMERDEFSQEGILWHAIGAEEKSA